MGQVISDQSVLSALEIEKLNSNSLFGIYHHCKHVPLSTQVSDIEPSWSSCFYSSAFKWRRKQLFLRTSYLGKMRVPFNQLEI